VEVVHYCPKCKRPVAIRQGTFKHPHEGQLGDFSRSAGVVTCNYCVTCDSMTYLKGAEEAT